jgi:hypothetical protein
MDAAGGRALGGDDETAPSGAIGARSNSVRQGWWGAIVGRAASVLRRGKKPVAVDGERNGGAQTARQRLPIISEQRVVVSALRSHRHSACLAGLFVYTT